MDSDLVELYKWIDNQPITRQKKNINRDFADAIPLVEILKEHYPKLVEIHNYSPQNAYNQKLSNWRTLNRKVLNKLKINLTVEEMEGLAKAQTGAIENLLFIIKDRINRKSADDDINLSMVWDPVVEIKDGVNYSGTEIIPVRIRNGKNIFRQKIVPTETFNEMEKSLKEKTEEIASLQYKIVHLEHLLKAKEERINELTNQIESIVNSSTPRTRFFKGIF